MSEHFALNYLIRGDHFDSEFRNKANDLEFYIRSAGTNPLLRILELGVGTGRIAIPLAQQGHAVSGVDFSQSMLGKTKSKAEALGVSILLENSDIREFHFSGEWDLIISPFNTLMHFSSGEAELLLSKIAGALGRGGRFIDTQGWHQGEKYSPGGWR